MPGKLRAGSISRTLLLPFENQGTLRLRYQLAEDGCKESQVALAKCLLSSTFTNVEERNSHAQLAVYWLLRAANKGQAEALGLLRDCADAGVGISTVNSFEVEKCLSYSDDEVLSRRVAFSVFRAIMSDTEDVLSEESFREKIEKILSEDDEPASVNEEVPAKAQEKQVPKLTEDVSLKNQPHVTFNSVVSSVQTCLEGNVPLVSLTQVAEFETTKWLIFKYVSTVKNIIIASTEDFIKSFALPSVLVAVLLLALIVAILQKVSVPGTEFSAFLYRCNVNLNLLMCLLAMLSCSCFIISVGLGVDNFKKWLHLVKFFEPNVKSAEVEWRYLSKTLYPLLSFFVISVFYLILQPLNPIHNSLTELGVFALILMVFLDRSVSHQRYYVNISLLLNALTCLYKYNIIQKFSHSSLEYFNLKIIYDIGLNSKIYISFITCLALPFVLPFLYLKMALANELKGWHLVLLPHLMSVTWMNIAFSHLSEIDSSILMFNILTCLIIMILSRYFGFVVTFALYCLIKVTIISGYLNLQLLLILPVFMTLYILSAFLVKKFKFSYDSKLWCLVTNILIITLCCQGLSRPSPADDASNKVLPWENYQSQCHYYNSWYRPNPAEVQIKCLPFIGRKVYMEAVISTIEITRITNSLELMTSFLPQPFHDWVVCAFGKRYSSCDSAAMSPTEREKCLLYETLNISCHLHDWDEYSYQMTVEVATRGAPEAIFHADHTCSSFIRGLKEGDTLKAVGVLESNVGGYQPKLRLIKAECSSCSSNIECNKTFFLPPLDYSLPVKNIVRFYLSPFIQFGS